MHEDIITQLDELAKLKDELYALLANYEGEREEILSPVKPLLDEVEARIVEATTEVRAAIADKELEIKTLVITAGQTIKGSCMQAVYNAGRVAWDARALDGYAVGHPELFAFRKEGQPSVSFREVKRT